MATYVGNSLLRSRRTIIRADYSPARHNALSQIAFDAGQKAVLTSCVLVNQSVLSRKRKSVGGDKAAKRKEEAMINVSRSPSFRRMDERSG